MSFKLACLLLLSWTVSSGATHDETAYCSLSGVYKTRQSVLQSPNYPDNYPPSTCWDYVVRSPYHCPTTFHIQFLDFYLESSPNCSNDYLAIGLDSVGDDMDLLCGQVIGIKKYHTPNGILRLRFFSNDSPWTIGKGFKLLVTRLACERDEVGPPDNGADSARVPALELQPPQLQSPSPFQHSSLQAQHRLIPLVPLFSLPALPPTTATPHPGLYQPSQTTAHNAYSAQDRVNTVSPAMSPGSEPCRPIGSSDANLSTFYLPTIHQHQQLPQLNDQYPFSSWQSSKDDLQFVDSVVIAGAAQGCCSRGFRQRRFYLSSPGFPRTALTSLLPNQQRDCFFQFEKATPQVCRLRMDFKFFDFGKNSDFAAGLPVGANECTEDFVEIDGERFCGCRTGFVHAALWPAGDKLLRIRMGYSGLPAPGFLLDILQEECELVGPNQLLPSPHGVRPFFPLTQLHQLPLLPSSNAFLYLPYKNEPQFWPPPSTMPQYQRSRHNRQATAYDIVQSDSPQPYSVVVTNATRKEFYYHDGVKAYARHRSLSLGPVKIPRTFSVDYPLTAGHSGLCSFDMSDSLRLASDVLWQMKPICYAPQPILFANHLG